MSFDSVGAGAILLIATLLTATSVAFLLKATTDDAISTSVVMQKHYNQQLRSSIAIEHGFASASQVTLYVRNTGQAPLDLNETSVVIGNEYFNTVQSQVSAAVLADTDTVNTGIFDKDEVAQFNITTSLNSGSSYVVKIFTQYQTNALYTLTYE